MLFAALAYSSSANASALTAFERCGDPCVIERNEGGLVLEFVQVHDLLVAQRRMMVVDGECISSCSMLADLLRQSKLVCVTPKAAFLVHRGVFGYQSAYRGFLSVYLELPYSTEFQATVDRLGGAPKGNKFVRIEGADMLALFPACPAKVPRSPVP